MTKNKKLLYTIIAIILIFVIIGIDVKKYIDNKKQKIIEQFKPSMEIYLKTYYNNIDTVTVDDVERIPTGSICLNGYVNGNKELPIYSFIHYIDENGTLKPVIENVEVGTLEMDTWEKEEYINSDKHYPAYQLLEQQKEKEKQ